jgi:hypothetical protein
MGQPGAWSSSYHRSGMIHPSPTTPIDPALARGVYLRTIPATATRPELIVLGVPDTSYELHLRPVAPVRAEPGERLVGVITARARRVDAVRTGGLFIEPVMGRPRRVQGRVVRGEGGALVVRAGGVPVHLVLTDGRQRAEDFEPGLLVGCDVLEGATFEARPEDVAATARAGPSTGASRPPRG